jgi:hypothetical protein
MTNYIRNGIIGLAGLVIISGCQPEYVTRLVKPLEEKAEHICSSYGNNQRAYESDKKFTQVSNQTKELLTEIGCDPKCIKWTCGRDDVFEDYKMSKSKNPCSCKYSNLEEAMQEMTPEQAAKFKKALDAAK